MKRGDILTALSYRQLMETGQWWSICWLLSGALLAPSAHAHCDGIKHGDGHPHCAGGGGEEPPPDSECRADARFPAVLYPADVGLVLNSDDGCRATTVASGFDWLSGYRLQYFEESYQGFVAWSEVDFIGDANSVLKRKRFDVASGEISFASTEVVYQTSALIRGFDLVEAGGVETLAVVEGNTIRIADPSLCSGSCTSTDFDIVYPSPEGCLEDPLGQCFDVSDLPALSPAADALYFKLGGDAPNEDPHPQAPDTRRIDLLAGIEKTSGWVGGTTKIVLQPDHYDGLGAPSVSADGRYIAIDTTYGLVYLDLTQAGQPPLANEFAQFEPIRSGGTWTRQGLVVVLTDEGKARKLVHPMELMNPTTGERVPMGIVLGSHPPVDTDL